MNVWLRELEAASGQIMVVYKQCSPETNQQIKDQAEKDMPVNLRMQIIFETLLSCIIFKYE